MIIYDYYVCINQVVMMTNKPGTSFRKDLRIFHNEPLLNICLYSVDVVRWSMWYSGWLRVTVNSSFTFHVAGALGTVLLWLTLTLDYFNILLDLSKMFYCVRITLCKSLITFLCISWAVCLPGFLTHNSNNLCIIPHCVFTRCRDLQIRAFLI